MPDARSKRIRPLPPEQWYPKGDDVARARFLTLRSGDRIRVVEAGPADGRPILLLHGWGGSAYCFRRLLPLLATSGYRAAAPDLRGHGLSEKPNERTAYASPAIINHTLEIIDALGFDSSIVVGQSMSGAIALDLWIRGARIDAALLLAPIGLAPIRRITVARLLRTSEWRPGRVPRWVVTFVLRRVYGSRSTWSSRDVDEYWAPFQDRGSVAGIFNYVDVYDWSLRGPTTSRPPLVFLFGEKDRLIPAARAARRAAKFRHSLISIIPGAGHLLAEEVPDDVIAAIQRLPLRSPV